ncbi:hypothetical protein TRAPUB_11624 [Trametes pubescens]|uniref:Uncharacterized protein n=1 Tax=Trametes pubescens TaxID=154538 RepID=A0A1M2VW41_TRAPU|nr:hypothetical protein TRAPUB_11624 [Trametes pubescens]
MAQSPPIPTPNVFKPPVPPSPTLQTSNPSLFYPRKEFIRDQRIVSSFSLLTLAGSGFVRLYSFPHSVINALRRFFELQKIIVACRENETTHFFEFALDHKPWANLKNIVSEKLVVGIFSILLQYGYSLLSTIEYGREQDDRIAIAFSRPTTAPASSAIPIIPSNSTSTLPHTGPMMFAISFPTPRVLRVIDPPLPLTPAILQAVRNAWPRGIADEKKFGDSYEFKLKGYKWFQENTFAIDSLQQILSLLSALDRHSFTLLASLTIGNRARTKDFWIFTGPPGEHGSLESPPASPTGSSMELKQNGFAHHNRQARSSSPFASSPLKQVTLSAGSKLKKPFPKADLPHAFKSDASLNESIKLPSDVGSVDMTGVGTAHRRAASQPHNPDVFYTTGPQGDTRQQEFNPWNRTSNPATPTAPMAAHYPSNSMGRQHSRHQSLDDPFLRGQLGDSPYDIARPRTGSLGSQAPTPIASPPPAVRVRRISSPLASTAIDGMQPLPTPTMTPFQDPFRPDNGQRGSQGSVRVERGNLSDMPRIPTPPLLGAGAFRDSAFSSSTGWRTTDVPITWTGKDPEPGDEKRRTGWSGVFDAADPAQPGSSPPRVLHGPRERRQSGGPRGELSTSRPPSQSPPPIAAAQEPQPQEPRLERFSSTPAFPGAWAPTPQEEKRQDDVVPAGSLSAPGLAATATTTTMASNMLPPTIKEQPSQEGDDAVAGARARNREVKAHSPEQHQAEGEGARKSEAAWIGNTNDRTPPNGTMPKGFQQTANSYARLPPTAAAANGNAATKPRSSSISEGWVLVNIDGRVKSGGSRSPGQGGPPRPTIHTRSSSDSRVPTPAHHLAHTTAGAGKSTMSPAAKAIVMVDAIGVKEAEREKAAQGQGSRFKKLLGRGKDKDKSASPTPERSPPPQQQKGRQGSVPPRGSTPQPHPVAAGARVGR